MPIPIHMVSANFSGTFGVLYVDKDGYISWLQETFDTADPSKPTYTLQNAIQLNKKVSIQASFNKVAIIGYTGKDQQNKHVREFRLYYVEKKTSQVKEICMTVPLGLSAKDQEWYEGIRDSSGKSNGSSTFNAENIKAAPDSPLTATCVSTDGVPNIRVYFKKAGETSLSCAWTTVKQSSDGTTKYWDTFVVREGAAL